MKGNSLVSMGFGTIAGDCCGHAVSRLILGHVHNAGKTAFVIIFMIGLLVAFLGAIKME